MMLTVIKFILILLGLLFVYQSGVCLFDSTRINEHSSAWFAMGLGAVSIMLGIFTPNY